MRYLEAAHYTPTGGRQIDLIVIHSAEAPEKFGKAWAVAQWFAGNDAPHASAHFVADDSEIVQCVYEQHIAWAAPGANHNGLHVELIGYARQTHDEWQDAYSLAMLERVAALVAALCKGYSIPSRALVAADLLVDARGITTHAEVSKAFRKSTHTDPGPNFPMARFVQRVAELRSSGGA